MLTVILESSTRSSPCPRSSSTLNPARRPRSTPHAGGPPSLDVAALDIAPAGALTATYTLYGSSAQHAASAAHRASVSARRADAAHIAANKSVLGEWKPLAAAAKVIVDTVWPAAPPPA